MKLKDNQAAIIITEDENGILTARTVGIEGQARLVADEICDQLDPTLEDNEMDLLLSECDGLEN